LPSEHGIEVIDMRTPGRPRRLGGNTGFSALSLAVDDTHVYAITRERDFLVLDRFVPTRLSLELGPTANEVALHVTGLPGLPVRLQRSTDLGTWEEVSAVTLGGDSMPIIDASGLSQSGQRFYRTTSPLDRRLPE
jgi:hypothetical protein